LQQRPGLKSFLRFVPGEATLQRDPEVPNDQNSPPAKTVAWAFDSLENVKEEKISGSYMGNIDR
jgi:hypothetical protein